MHVSLGVHQLCWMGLHPSSRNESPSSQQRPEVRAPIQAFRTQKLNRCSFWWRVVYVDNCALPLKMSWMQGRKALSAHRWVAAHHGLCWRTTITLSRWIKSCGICLPGIYSLTQSFSQHSSGNSGCSWFRWMYCSLGERLAGWLGPEGGGEWNCIQLVAVTSGIPQDSEWGPALFNNLRVIGMRGSSAPSVRRWHQVRQECWSVGRQERSVEGSGQAGLLG